MVTNDKERYHHFDVVVELIFLRIKLCRVSVVSFLSLLEVILWRTNTNKLIFFYSFTLKKYFIFSLIIIKTMAEGKSVNGIENEEQCKMDAEAALKFIRNMQESMGQVNNDDLRMMEAFRTCVQQGERLQEQFKKAVEEKRRLEMELGNAEMKRSTKEIKLKQAHSLIDREKYAAKKAFREGNYLRRQRDDILRTLPDSQRSELVSRLSSIQPNSGDSTSDIHFTTDTASSSVTHSSEADSDDRHVFPVYVSKQRSIVGEGQQCSIVKKEDNEEGNKILSDNTSATADSVHESTDRSSFLSDSNFSSLFFTTSMEKFINRPHKFRGKTFVLGDKCIVCLSKVSCGAHGLQCEDCNCVTHKICENFVPKPCISMSRIRSSSPGSICDYCPQLRPYIPPLVVHCILQIEKRGLTEAGLYKVPSFDRSVQVLKSRWLINRDVTNLSQIDVYVLSDLLKDFFASLKPSLISSEVFTKFRKYFAHNSHPQIRYTNIYDIVCCLQPASKDTLAFLILHLQKVVNSPACKMSARRLSKVFTRLLVDNYKPECYKKESQKWSLLEKLIELSSDMWECILLKDL